MNGLGVVVTSGPCVCKINIVELFKLVWFNAREYDELLQNIS